ncbi:GNAT family N-acetyltransferase [Flavisericum labens]|uniref:GNAT family N-acetyltransferase n=1 Tax=Flavisericum labens TaxID=3377112 RepID=UPI00387AA728
MLSFGDFNIQPIQIEDYWNICNFVVANENRLKRYFPKTLQQNSTPDLSKIFVEKQVKQFELKEEFLFTLKYNHSKTISGLIYLKAIDWHKKQAEFAYCIDYNFEGQGITTKSIKLLSDYAFKKLNLRTLQIIVHKTNSASIKVAENCNFTWIKTLEKEHAPPGGNALDMELYELYDEIE